MKFLVKALLVCSSVAALLTISFIFFPHSVLMRAAWVVAVALSLFIMAALGVLSL